MTRFPDAAGLFWARQGRGSEQSRNPAQHAPQQRHLLLSVEPGYIHRMSKISPIESEFATTEDAEAHDHWFREKVEAALASDTPPFRMIR